MPNPPCQDTAPLTFDPEHTNLNEATVARLADYKEEGSEEGETAVRLRLRAGAALQELSEDPRCSGRAVSRRSLEEEDEESGKCTCGAALVASGYSNAFIAVVAVEHLSDHFEVENNAQGLMNSV